MARVTEAEVLGIAPSITLTPITAFIDAASSIVDTINSKCTKNFDVARLTQIELFLSAHFVTMAVGTGSKDKSSESIGRGDYDVTYAAASLGSGMLGSTYGQMASVLSEGCLAEWDKRQAQAYFAGAG